MRSEYLGYQSQVLNDHAVMMDFLWKSPNFIRTEVERERKKLWTYFPDMGEDEIKERNSQLRKLRAQIEGRKLFGIFPNFIAQSNLYLVTSTFEQHLLKIAHLYEQKSRATLRNTSGNGIDRYIRFFIEQNILVDQLSWYHELQAIKAIRNCLLHASGDLTLSRDRKFVEQVVKSELYKPLEGRGQKGMEDDQGRPEIEIKDGRVFINFYFPTRAAIALTEFLYCLVEAVPAALKLPPAPYISA